MDWPAPRPTSPLCIYADKVSKAASRFHLMVKASHEPSMRAMTKLVNVILGPGRPPPSMPVEERKVTSKEPPVLANVVQTPIKVRAVSNFPETLVSLSSDFPDVAKISDP